jgi:hypothetical protein
MRPYVAQYVPLARPHHREPSNKDELLGFAVEPPLFQVGCLYDAVGGLQYHVVLGCHDLAVVEGVAPFAHHLIDVGLLLPLARHS